ncbi:kinase-like domain-containing protein [Rhizophagus clarus]|uniref:Kinase-like domain-containing protein n=1 Tax=Rhizophagus clarus TaxID=94130 RepID=A0A8H3LDM9_9GLOM|nr:kinase-like domain-containing protein [Rhizophagus clarus]
MSELDDDIKKIEDDISDSGNSKNSDHSFTADNILSGKCEKCGEKYIDEDHTECEWTRYSDKNVTLKYMNNSCNSQDIVNEFLDEVNTYLRKDYVEIIDIDHINRTIYGISQNLDTMGYIMVFGDLYKNNCKNCGEIYMDVDYEWCKLCQINRLKDDFTNWSSENEEIVKKSSWVLKIFMTKYLNGYPIWEVGPLYYNENDKKLIREFDEKVALKCLYNSQNKIDEFLSEVKTYLSDNKDKDIPHIYGISQNPDSKDYIMVLQDGYCEQCGQGGFSIIYSAIWKDGPLVYNNYDYEKRGYERIPNKKVALKCLFNSQNITLEFLNEIKSCSMNKYTNIINVYGISRNPDSKEYIMVLEYAEGGNFSDWMRKNYEDFEWKNKINALSDIIDCLMGIHQNKMVHRDFHTGNILFMNDSNICISDMGLSGKIDDKDKTNVYGVMPYIAPEVLSDKPYTKASDIYSFALNIINGFRPEIYEFEEPKYYIDLMKKCWDSNPENRPNAIEIGDLLSSFEESFTNVKETFHYEFDKQFRKAEKHRILDLYSYKQANIHPQAIYTSRLLNSRPKYSKT